MSSLRVWTRSPDGSLSVAWQDQGPANGASGYRRAGGDLVTGQSDAEKNRILTRESKARKGKA